MRSENLKGRNTTLLRMGLFLLVVFYTFTISREAFAHPGVLDVELLVVLCYKTKPTSLIDFNKLYVISRYS
ncbi:MAG TPA: hypothetical protein DCG53_02330 [Syntrophus sp. (in: bacteria)]|nr:hypothetical protein [Syntrophus sp. (in: bacteria)]